MSVTHFTTHNPSQALPSALYEDEGLMADCGGQDGAFSGRCADGTASEG